MHAPEVYAKGRENFQKLIRDGALKQDAQPCFYLYRQVMGTHTQTGLVAAASCEEYLRGIIKKHELTRVDKEDDRVRHIETLERANRPGVPDLSAPSAPWTTFVAEKTSGKPEIDFTAEDGVRHMSWTIRDAARYQIHRDAICADSVPVHRRRPSSQRGGGAGLSDRARARAQSGQFLAVIFPHNQMQILPYNRVLKDLNGWTPEQLLEMLGAVFAIDSQTARRAPGARTRTRPLSVAANGTRSRSADKLLETHDVPENCST